MSNMQRQVLTQEELDLLLQGVPPDPAGNPEQVEHAIGSNTETGAYRDGGPATAAYRDGGPVLSLADRQTLAKIVDISMKKAAESLSQLIRKPVTCDFPDISETTWDSIVRDGIISSERIVTTVSFIEGLEHDNLMVIKTEDAKAIVDLMMGGKGRTTTGELDDLKMSAVGEAMNQMMGTSATALADIFDKRVIISTPKIKIVDAEEQILSSYRKQGIVLVRIVLTMTIDEPVRTEIYQIIPISNALEMIKKIVNEGALYYQAPPPAPAKTIGRQAERPAAADQQAERLMAADQQAERPAAGAQQAGRPATFRQQAERPATFRQQAERPAVADQQAERPVMARQDLTERMVPAQPVQFLPLEASDPMISGLARQAEYSKLELILDVPLQFVVELGRTEKTLQEILELGPGSVISLEKLAGESLDILVNGKFIAKGEVIVIDENYGVRIKEILNQEDRLGSIKNRA